MPGFGYASAAARRRDIRWVKSAICVVVGILTVASGLLDARGFVYASRAWPGGQLDAEDGAGIARLLRGRARRPTSWP